MRTLKRFLLLTIVACFTCISVKAQSGAWKFIATGDGSSYAIDKDGALWSWGWNESGQLGIGGGNNKYSIPQRVGEENNWAFVTAGKAYAFFIKKDGTLWAVGDNSKNVQGVGDGQSHKVLTQVGTDRDWKTVAVTRFFGYSALAIKTNGTLWAWGEGESGALGLGNYKNYATPTQVGTDNDWKDVSVGNGFTIALKNDGSLWGWGWNARGCLWDLPMLVKVPTQMGTETDWVSVFAVAETAYGIKTDGSLWVWGYCDNNTFGFDNPELTEIKAPKKVETLNGKVKFISGYDAGRTAVVEENGKDIVYTWGSNADEALGNGKGVAADAGSGIEMSPVPTKINLPEDIVFEQLACGEGFSILRGSNDKLYGWGKNRGGQLGNYCPEDQMTFVQSPIKVGEKSEQTDETLTFSSEEIPGSLLGIKKLKLVGAWGTSDFQKLTQTIGNNSGFPPAGNTVIEEIDMSGATIKPNTSLFVPNGLSNAGTFQGCKALKVFVMPSAEEQANIVNLRSAFQNCTALTELDLTGCVNVKEMTDMMFGCKSIKKIDISNCVNVKGSESAFDRCEALEEIIMPAQFTLGKFTFGYCHQLKLIDWSRYGGDTAPDMPNDLFQDLDNDVLTNITLIVPETSFDSFVNHNDWKKLNVVKASATSVSGVEQTSNEKSYIYNLNGIIVGSDLKQLKKGIYIINGKKVVVD